MKRLIYALLFAAITCACEKAPNGLDGTWVLESSELLPQTVIGFDIPVETVFKYKGNATYRFNLGVLTISGEKLKNRQYTYTSDGSVLFIDIDGGQRKYGIVKVDEAQLSLQSSHMLNFIRK